MLEIVNPEIKVRIEESLFDGMPTFVALSDTGVSIDRESILASARVLGLLDGCWHIELSVSNEFGLPNSIDAVSPPNTNLVDAVMAAHDFVEMYAESPKRALKAMQNVRDAGCACGECYNGKR